MRPKLPVALLFLLLVGCPALITWNLIQSEVQTEVVFGSQPGATVQGTVVDTEGTPIEDVPLLLRGVGPGRRIVVLAEVRTGVDGKFTLATPPFEGSFELLAGGDPWTRIRKRFSFLGSDGELVPLEDLELVLEPGSRLDLEFRRLDGGSLGSGRYDLSGVVSNGMFALPRVFARRGTFEGGRLALDGLPVMTITLRVEFTTGDRVEMPLELVVGENARVVEL